MKKILSVIIFFFLSYSFAEDWNGSTSKPSSKEINGVEYYVISSPNELAWFAYQVNEKRESKINAILGNDIHFMDDDSATSSVRWTAIGLSDTTIYDGIFDGAGYIIYGLYSKGTIFGYTGTDFILKNFSVKKSDVVTWVAFNNGIIEDCVEENNGARQIAGFAYKNNGIIRKCRTKNFGIATINSGMIEGCESQGVAGMYTSVFKYGKFEDITKGKKTFAGIADSNNGIIKRCVFEPLSWINMPDDVTFGGIASVTDSNSIIDSCRFKGNISYKNQNASDDWWIIVGGIAGVANKNAVISHSQVRIDTLVATGIGFAWIGGIVGRFPIWNENLGNGMIFESYAEVYIDTLLAPFNYPYEISIGGLAGEARHTEVNYSHASLRFGKGLSVGKAYVFYCASLVGNFKGRNDRMNLLKASYGTISSNKWASNYMFGGVVSIASYSQLGNSYYDKSLASPDTMHAVGKLDGLSTQTNVLGKTTAVMQSPAFVETLNTNAGLDDDSGIWQYCEGNYPILVSEGTCEEFYSKYGPSSSLQSSSSSVESSSSNSVVSSSSKIESSSSSESVLNSSSSCVDEISSSSIAESSSSTEPDSSSSEKHSSSSIVSSSSSVKLESSSSSKVNSSSSGKPDFVIKSLKKMFNLEVNGMTLTLSNTQGGFIRIFDALGHLVVSKQLSSTEPTVITMQTPGNYIVRMNGVSKAVNLK